jgi:hypothetical protein
MTETEDEPLTLPPLEWTYREDPEPFWTSGEYVIRVRGTSMPYELRCGSSEMWHVSTFVSAKAMADRHHLKLERSRRDKERLSRHLREKWPEDWQRGYDAGRQGGLLPSGVRNPAVWLDGHRAGERDRPKPEQIRPVPPLGASRCD